LIFKKILRNVGSKKIASDKIRQVIMWSDKLNTVKTETEILRIGNKSWDIRSCKQRKYWTRSSRNDTGFI